MTLLSYTLIFIMATSGNSTLLVMASIGISALYALFYFGKASRRQVRRQDLLMGMVALLALMALSVTIPFTNAVRFILSIYFLVGATFLWSFILSKPIEDRARFFENIIRLYLLGSLIQLSGVLGGQMEVYKDIVQHPLLSNLEREQSLSVIGLRLFGFFSEPSYFAAHYALACAALFLSGVAKRAAFYFLIGFILCPSPNFFIAIAVILYAQRRNIALSPKYTLAGTILLVVVFILMSERLSSFVVDINLFLAGGYALTSFSERLVLPILSLTALVQDGQLPLPYGCIRDGTCDVSLTKLPVLTFWAFFSLWGAGIYIFFVRLLTKKSLLMIVFFLLLGTAFSGGGGFMPHFALIIVSCLFIASMKSLSLKDRHALYWAGLVKSAPLLTQVPHMASAEPRTGFIQNGKTI